MTNRVRTAFQWILSIAVSAIALYYALRGVEWMRVWHTIAGARLAYLSAACGITCCSFFLRGVRWRILLNAAARFDLATVFWANMAGYLGNSFLPARAGEIVRSLLISRRSSLSRAYVLTTALGERLMDVVALVLCGSVVLLEVSQKPAWMDKASATMMAVAALGALAVMILPHTGNLLTRTMYRVPMPEKLRVRLLALADQVLLGLRAFHDWGRFTGFAVLTSIVWSADAWTAVMVGKSLRVEISFPAALLLMTGLGLSSALPSTPGYVGVYQFAVITVLAPFGVGRAAALAYSLVLQATGYALVLALGLPGLYLLQGSGSLRKLSEQARTADNIC